MRRVVFARDEIDEKSPYRIEAVYCAVRSLIPGRGPNREGNRERMEMRL